MLFAVFFAGNLLYARPAADTAGRRVLQYSDTVFFRINSPVVDLSFGNNREKLLRLEQELDRLIAVGCLSVDSIVVVSASSVDGRESLNRALAERRGVRLVRELKRLLPQVPDECYVRIPVGEDWAEFRRIVESDPRIPAREELLEIIASDLPADAKEKRFRSMKPTFEYILRHHLARMRYSAVTVCVSVPDSGPKMIPLSAPQFRAETPAAAQAQLPSAAERGEQAALSAGLAGGRKGFRPGSWMPVFNVKTNLLYDVGAFPTLELEIPLAPRWSFNLEGSVAWWSSYRHDAFYQLNLLSPEVRWWFGQRSRWHGHYVGLFGMLGLYDLEWPHRRGYQGEYWAAGASYGYMFPISRHLSLETGVGLGFLHTEYREYLPMDGHYVYQQTSRTRFVGPVKLKVGLVWRIGDRSYEREKAERRTMK